MKKHAIGCLIFTLSIAFLSAVIKSDAVWWLVVKYTSLALSFFTCGYCVALFTHLPQCKSSFLSSCFGCFGLLGILCFIFLTMDTFVFHTWSWYPGLFRYVLYDAYGICYLAFSIFGICFYVGNYREA